MVKKTESMPEFLVLNDDGILGPEKGEPPAAAVRQDLPPAPGPNKDLPRPGPADVSASAGPGGPTLGPAAPTAPSLPSGRAVELTTSLSMQPGQRGATERMQKSGSAVLAEKLGPQLGTAPEYLAHMQIDERKMAVLNDLTATSLVYLRFRAWVDGVRFWQWFVDGELVTSQAIGGLARRHVLKALEAGQGGQIKETQRPGVFARNIWSRDWQHKAEMRGDMPQEYGEE